MARGVPIVGVEVGDIRAGRGFEPRIAGGGDPTRFGIVDLDESEPIGIVGDHPGRVIGRTVVDDDDLELVGGEVLVDQTLKASADRLLGVLRRDDDADDWLGHVVLPRDLGCCARPIDRRGERRTESCVQVSGNVR